MCEGLRPGTVTRDGIETVVRGSVGQCPGVQGSFSTNEKPKIWIQILEGQAFPKGLLGANDKWWE